MSQFNVETVFFFNLQSEIIHNEVCMCVFIYLNGNVCEGIKIYESTCMERVCIVFEKVHVVTSPVSGLRSSGGHRPL